VSINLPSSASTLVEEKKENRRFSKVHNVNSPNTLTNKYTSEYIENKESIGA
jgi:hypothetical protein